eukprot:CAMPEP_0171633600 /NCGR_PEP_ID=MMETSP0990-20121206/25327_1 /TAXON_ID=483369 /ORGANISM="non described non described, Strain CCMP2098" /LENGTH=241 /DNA_ID=CAMNT_0012204403 /DNA_START=148 /DNA_END=873 /DNA_ORIENTATION=-
MGGHLSKEYHPSGTLKFYKGVMYEEDGTTIVDSIFQRIADGVESPSGEEKELCFQDDRVACFVPMNAVSRQGHVLVVPRVTAPEEHPADSQRISSTATSGVIKTVADLESSHTELLLHMRHVGTTVLHQRLSSLPNRRGHVAGMNMNSRAVDVEVPTTIPAIDTTLPGTTDNNKIPDSLKRDIFLSFHQPPFNSIDHLHLHCIAEGPRRNVIDYLKYPTFDTPWCVNLATVLKHLEEKENA